MVATDILFARQPIYDAHTQRHGFELLFRDSGDAASAPAMFDGEAATGRVLVNAFSNADIDLVCEGRPAFVNFTAKTITHALPFEPERLVIEVLESVEATPDVHAALMGLNSAGYRIALDDYAHAHAEHPLLSYAQIVKLEYPAFSPTSLARAIKALRARYPAIRILAEKIETREDFERCRSLGCDLFQGYFLARPEPVHGQLLPAAHVRVIELLARLNDPKADVEQVSRLVSADPYLSLRLLKLVNSSTFGVARKITSLSRAILALGLNRVRAFASLLVLSRLERKPRALQYIAISRSLMCQHLCEKRAAGEGPMGFMIGLLSCLDAFMDRPLPEILKQAPFDPIIIDAVVERKGPLGAILEATLRHERGDLEATPWTVLRAIGIDTNAFMEAFRDAVGIAGRQGELLA
ncbi:signal transduction protein [Salinisphaera sp. T5B8]|uniref:EAL and HDOD domain-containing protein n=1 Tax=Salinisphaera sp. T5B8 TaxID=1304154 RepID=UPI00333F1E04